MDELIYKADVRKAILQAHPASSYCIDNIRPVTNYKRIVKGKWVPWAGGLVGCSVCGYEYTDYLECKHFCGNCGADMREDNNGNTKD